MKKIVSLIIATLICFSSVMIVSAEDVPAITDLISPEQVSGLENIDVISTASNEETIVALTEDNNNEFYLNYSTDGVKYSKVNVGEQLKEYMPYEKEGFSFILTGLQKIDEVVIVFGHYILEEEWTNTYFIFKTESAENVVVDFTELEKGEMGAEYHRGKGAYIRKCNDKYIYCFEKFEAYENVEYIKEGEQYKAYYSAYCFYYVSDDLKEWEKYETPSFDSTSAGGTPYLKLVVSEKGILIIGYLRWIGSEFDSPQVEFFCKTNDFENYENLDMSIFEGYEDAPFIFEYFTPDMPDGNILLMYSSNMWEEIEGEFYVMWTSKYYDCYLIDIVDGTCKKIISEESKSDTSLNWMAYSVYPGVGIMLYSEPDEDVTVYSYDFDVKTVAKSIIQGEKFYEIRTDLSDGCYAFWDCEENLTYTVGFGCNGDGNVSIVNYDMSDTYLFNVTQTESLFVWNEKDIAYFYSDDDCIAVSLTELLSKLKGDDSPEPDTPTPDPDEPGFEAVCPECGEMFTDVAEYDRHMESHNDDEYDAPVLDKEFEVNTPTTSTVNYGDTLILHALVSEIPEGCSIVWSVEGTGVTLSPSADGITCAVTCMGSGAVRVTATVIDSQGNVVLDSDGNECVSGQTLTAKAGFFQKLISFFKNLFGLLRIIPQSFKVSF